MEEYRREEDMEKKGSDPAFVLGILSIVFVAVCQIVGLILGIIGIRKARGRKSETGWTLSVIGVVLNAVIIAFVIIFIIVGLVFLSEAMKMAYYW